jgi:hypothetical protein
MTLSVENLKKELIHFYINEKDSEAVSKVAKASGVRKNDITGILIDYCDELDEASKPNEADEITDKYIIKLLSID